MRRWLRILVVGSLTVVMAIDSASACRFVRRRCRPRCRVVTCRMVETGCRPSAVIDACNSSQCCVPADGSAHAVIDEQEAVAAPGESAPVAKQPTPAMPEPRRIDSQVPSTEPVMPASAENPLPAPQFKTAAEILAESEEKNRREQEAARVSPPMPAPQFKTAAEILAEAAEKEAAEKPADSPLADTPEPATEKPMAKGQDRPEEPAEPAKPEESTVPAPSKPAGKKPEDNLFDEDAAPPGGEDRDRSRRQPPKKRGPADDAPDNLFDEPDAPPPKAPAEEPAATEDNPFAGIVEPPAEPVRRWIDDTGRHETVGRLVEIRADSVRILKGNGRHTTVPLGRLSRHDLNYVRTTGERLAAQKAATPAVTDTARR